MRGIPSRWAECPDVFHRIHIHQWSAMEVWWSESWLGQDWSSYVIPKLFRVCFCCGISQICKTFRQHYHFRALIFQGRCWMLLSLNITIWYLVEAYLPVMLQHKVLVGRGKLTLQPEKKNEVVQSWNVCNIFLVGCASLPLSDKKIRRSNY